MNRRSTQLIQALVSTFAMAACGGPTYSAGDPQFEGLDAEVVSEVLDQPDLVDSAEKSPGEGSGAQILQGRVIDTILCRETFAMYQKWVSTGEPGSLPAMPQPTHPTGGYAELKSEHQSRQKFLDHRDFEGLAKDLTGETRCGHDVTVKPRDAGGQTIEAAISAMKAPTPHG